MHLIRNFDPPSCRFLPSVPWPRFSSRPKFPCTSFFLKVCVFTALCFEFLIRLNRAPGSVETWCVCLCVLRSVVRRSARRMPTEQRRHMPPAHFLPAESESSSFPDELRLRPEVTSSVLAKLLLQSFLQLRGSPPQRSIHTSWNLKS